METSNQFDPNCVCGGTRERPQPDDCERCQFVVALAAETKRADDAEAKLAAAIDSLPAAEPKLLDPDEVKAVLAEALASQPMAKVWADAAINAMCGKVVGDAADARGEEG